MEKKVTDRERLLSCISKGQVAMLTRLLSKGVPADLPDRYGVTPLMEACRFGQIDCVKMLVDKGANVNVTDKEKASVLMHACTGDSNSKIVRYLIAHGARPDDRDAYGCTPLMRAASKGDVGIVNALINAGSDINAVSDNQETPTTFAIVWNRFKVVEALADAGAALDWSDEAGWTPLRYAIAERNWKIAEFLQDRGAPVALPLESGRRAASKHQRPC